MIASFQKVQAGMTHRCGADGWAGGDGFMHVWGLVREGQGSSS